MFSCSQLQVGFEIMVLDRSDTSVAGKEMIRHLKNCKIYAKYHDAPCFLISVASMPHSQDLRHQAQNVRIISDTNQEGNSYHHIIYLFGNSL